MLVGGLRVLLRAISMLLAHRMISLAVMFSGGTVSLGRVFVVFGCLVMFVFCHCEPRWLVAPCGKTGESSLFLPVDHIVWTSMQQPTNGIGITPKNRRIPLVRTHWAAGPLMSGQYPGNGRRTEIVHGLARELQSEQ